MDLFKHANEQMLNNTLLGVRQKFPLLDSALDNLQVIIDDKVPTCETDGKSVWCNPRFLESLSYDQRVTVLSHEVMHVAFDHILRSKDKDLYDWNISTDAVVNKILKDNGLPMIEGAVDMDEAKGKSAEEMYDLLHDPNKEVNQEPQESQDGNSPQSPQRDSQQGSSQSDELQSNQSQPNIQGENDQSESQSDGSGENDKQNSGAQPSEREKSNNNGSSESGDGSNKSSSGKQSDKQDNQSSGGEANNDADPNSSKSSNNAQVSNGDNANPNDEETNTNSQGENGEKTDQSQQPNVNNHSIWQEAVKKYEQDQELNKKLLDDKRKQSLNQSDTQYSNDDEENKDSKSDFEKEFERKNQAKKEEKGRELIRQMREHMGSKESGKGNSSSGSEIYTLGDVGKNDKCFSWKTILKRYMSDEVSMYSYRRADEDNYFQARVEDLEQFDRPGVEVMLDTSWSVSDSLLREFLRQLKYLIKDTKLKVGCFSDYAYDFVEVKKMSDIDHFKIKGRSGTDFNSAAQAFTWTGSDAQNLNRIIFTDGYADFTLTDKKYKKLIWVIYDNPEFKTKYGKIVHIKSQDIINGHVSNFEMQD